MHGIISLHLYICVIYIYIYIYIALTWMDRSLYKNYFRYKEEQGYMYVASTFQHIIG